MGGDTAASEIIGAIMLIGVIVGAFGIFSAIYLPSVVPSQVPHAKISMACNVSEGPDDIEYPCTRGSFNCHSFENTTCENDCRYRDFSDNPNLDSEDYEREISRCLENCMSPLCSDLQHCGVLYICHNGGDSLDIDSMKILVNGNEIARGYWNIKQQLVDELSFNSAVSGKKFQNGDSLRIISPSGGKPVDTVMISYTLPSGSEVTLALNQFGTDVE